MVAFTLLISNRFLRVRWPSHRTGKEPKSPTQKPAFQLNQAPQLCFMFKCIYSSQINSWTKHKQSLKPQVPWGYNNQTTTSPFADDKRFGLVHTLRSAAPSGNLGIKKRFAFRCRIRKVSSATITHHRQELTRLIPSQVWHNPVFLVWVVLVFCFFFFTVMGRIIDPSFPLQSSHNAAVALVISKSVLHKRNAAFPLVCKTSQCLS